MTDLTAQQIESNYDQFVKELTALTRKYGVAIMSVGGVMLADTESEFKDATYIADISSGDLYPNFQGNGGIRSNH
ncbi:hypothetical protein [Limnohabitans sp.]|jgi:hypothetical protein